MWAEIRAADGEAEQVARDLLSLARSKFDVQSTSDHGVFVVPAYLADLYADAMADVVPASEDAPAPKRRRARKEVE